MTRLFPALLFFAVAACASAEDPKKDPAKEKESSFRKLSLDKALEAAKKARYFAASRDDVAGKMWTDLDFVFEEKGAG